MPACKKPVKVSLPLAARPMTELLPACPNAPLENEGTTSKSPRGQVHFFPFFLAETRQEGRGRRVKPARFLSAPPSGRSEAERLDAAAALRTIVAENGIPPTHALRVLLLTLPRVPGRFSFLGDRLRLLTPFERSPWSVTG
jgi:hypothetical protein